MRGWWREKDYLGFIKENVITKEEALANIVERVYKDITVRGCIEKTDCPAASGTGVEGR